MKKILTLMAMATALCGCNHDFDRISNDKIIEVYKQCDAAGMTITVEHTYQGDPYLVECSPKTPEKPKEIAKGPQ